MSLSRTEVSQFTRKLYKFLKDDHKIEFKKMRAYVGQIETETYPTVILLDHRKDLIPTLIHEALHYFYPDASETWVLKMEKKIVSQLSQQQVRNIIRCLGQNI